MRIGLFTDTYLPDINGVVSSVELLRKKLVEMGNEVYVICTYPGVLKVQKEGNIIRLPGVEFKKLYGYAVTSPIHLFLFDDIEALKLDIIHVHTEFGVGIFAQMCAEKLHIPLVRTYHTTYEDYTHYVNFLGFDSIDKAAKKMVANISKLYGDKCMRLISPSEKTKEMLIRYGIKTPIKIIPTGTELDHFNSSNTSKAQIEEIRKECQINDDEKMLIYVGRIAQEKSINMLLEAFKIVKDKKLKIKLVIIGGGPDLDNLIQYAHKEELDGYVYFGNKRPFEKIPAYYHSADAFVSASITETQGMTYIEALASGLVIFARRDECVEDLLDEDQNGYYFDDANELVLKIEKFLNLDDKQYQEMTSNGVRKVAKYDANIFGQNIYKVYEEAISEYHRYYIVDSIKLKNDYVDLKLINSENKTEDIIVSLDTFYNKGIRKNERISLDIIDELKAEQVIVLAYKDALKKLANRDYTIKEMYDFLLKKYEISIDNVNLIIDKLEERGLLDDYKYTINRVASLENKLFSRKHMINQLRKEGVSVDIIEKVVIIDDDIEFKKELKLANRYLNSIRNKSIKMKKQTIIKKLLQEGYNYDIANQVIESLDFSHDVYNESEVLKKEANKTKLRLERKYKSTELRNRIYYSLASKGFSSEEIYAVLNEMEWKDE